MAVHHDLAINSSKFGPAAISPEANAFNENLMILMAQSPKWFEVGAARHRQMRIEGQTPLPKPVWLESAEEFDVPSRDGDRSIRCRMLRPEHGEPLKAVYMHMHSGGWVLGDEKTNDLLLQEIANKTGTMAVSVGYRHAPEDPFPAGPNDCYDVAEWLVDNAQSEFGAPFAFCGGESAGAQLGLLCMVHLLQSPTRKYADFRLQGMVLNYGCYDLTWSPSMRNFRKPATLIIDRELMDKYADVFLPGMSDEDKTHPSISPLYVDYEALRGKLPPALFTCGTEDPLIDDTIFLSSKWLMAGGEATIRIIPGAAHGYIAYTPDIKGNGADEGRTVLAEFMLSKLK